MMLSSQARSLYLYYTPRRRPVRNICEAFLPRGEILRL